VVARLQRFGTAGALQQCVPQAQRAAADLAALQWRHEPALLRCAAPSALQLPLMPPPVAHGWALRLPRSQLLERMRQAAAALLQLESSAALVRGQAVQVAQRFAEEASAAMPYVGPSLEAGCRAANEWRAGAAAHASSLRQLLEALLQLEAARGEEPPVSPAYNEAVRRVRAVHDAHGAAGHKAGAAQQALELLRRSRADALAMQTSVEQGAAAAEAAFNPSALPLVRATQKLAPALHAVHAALGDSAPGVDALRRAKHRAARLASAAIATRQRDPALAELAKRRAAQLAAALAAGEALPGAVEALLAAVEAARKELQKGGRGQAAARTQAADVVAALRPAMHALKPLVRRSSHSRPLCFAACLLASWCGL
jgi:hypothetical protein